MQKRNKKVIYKAIFSVCVVTICYAICIKYSGMLYHTNDDAGIQNSLSGFTTGNNDPYHQFISIFLGYPLATLYKRFPRIQWWFVYSQFLMIAGTVAIIFSLLCLNDGSREKKIVSISGIAAFILLYFIPNVSSTSFTIVPAFIGVGIVSLLFSGIHIHKRKAAIVIVCSLLYFLSYFHRKQSGMVVLVFFLLSLFYVFARQYGTNLKTFIALGITAVGLMVLSIGFSRINQNAKELINGQEFVSYNSARIEYMDYPRDTYDENPEIYEAVGWDRDTYLMASSWCFIDERIDEDSFHYIHEHSMAKQIPISQVWKKLWSNYASQAVMLGTLCGFFVAGLFLALNKSFLEIVFLALDFLLVVSLVVYQLIGRRILYRSVVVVCIPAFVSISLLLMCAKLDYDISLEIH